MTRTIAIIAVIVFIAIMGALIGAYFFFVQNGEGDIQIGDFLPFGSGSTDRDIAMPPPPSPVSEGVATSTEDASGATLRQLYSAPVSGMTSYGSEPMTIRFVERETGNVFDISADELTPQRITNTTIPRVQEALFATEEQVLVRYLGDDGETLQTFLAAILPAENGEGELTGSFLPQNARSMAVSSSRVFYTIDEEHEGYVSSLGSASASAVLPIPFTEWLPEWLSTNRIALTTKPSAAIPGSLYILNTQTSSMSRVLGDVPGLTALISPGGEQVLISESGNGRFSLSRYDIDDGTTEALSLRTLPEKCVWSEERTAIIYCGVPESIPAGEYPDVWYQGFASFSDGIWELDLRDGTTRLLARPTEIARAEIDLVNPMLTEDESHLVFMNKKDGSLWSLALEPIFTSEE